MGIFNFFKKEKKQESLKSEPIKYVSDYPKYDMYLEFLEMVKGKKVIHMFFGNTSLIPEHKRKDIKLFFEQCIKDGWVYVTKEKESVAESFTKNDFVKVLKMNNLPISGNKIDLVERIDSNLGLEMFYETDKVDDWIRLTDLGKAKIDEYKSDFNKKYDLFQQNIYNLFLSNKVAEACDSVWFFKESYPFEQPGFFMTHTKESLTATCKKIRTSNILEQIGVSEKYREAILSIMCMHYSFNDFDFMKKIEELYNGFKELLIKSDLVINKEYPKVDFYNLLKGLKVFKIDE